MTDIKLNFIDAAYHFFKNDIHREALKHVKNKDIAEDITQDVYLTFSKIIETEDLENYFEIHSKSLKNYLLNIARKVSAGYVQEIRVAKENCNFDDCIGVDTKSQKAMRLKEFEVDYLNQLDSDYKDILIYKCVHEFTNKELQDKMGLNSRQLEGRFYRAKKQLMHMIALMIILIATTFLLYKNVEAVRNFINSIITKFDQYSTISFSADGNEAVGPTFDLSRPSAINGYDLKKDDFDPSSSFYEIEYIDANNNVIKFMQGKLGSKRMDEILGEITPLITGGLTEYWYPPDKTGIGKLIWHDGTYEYLLIGKFDYDTAISIKNTLYKVEPEPEDGGDGGNVVAATQEPMPSITPTSRPVQQEKEDIVVTATPGPTQTPRLTMRPALTYQHETVNISTPVPSTPAPSTNVHTYNVATPTPQPAETPLPQIKDPDWVDLEDMPNPDDLLEDKGDSGGSTTITPPAKPSTPGFAIVYKSPKWIIDNYNIIAHNHSTMSHRITYKNMNNNKSITFRQTKLTAISVDNEQGDIVIIPHNNYNIHWYTPHDEDRRPYMAFWSDNDHLFTLTGWFELEDVFKMIDSLEVEK